MAAAFLFLLMLIAAKLESVPESRISGPYHVIDGDTLSVGEDRLRLEGIDAPELDQTCKYRDGSHWACGREAKKRLGELVHEDQVECLGQKRDRYRRLLVHCRSSDKDINAAMVRQGMAVSSAAYGQEQAAARRQELGLWAGQFEQPRAWRQSRGMMDDESMMDMLIAWVRRAAGGI
jgi:endonuclease YncB( thermonuclease family)